MIPILFSTPMVQAILEGRKTQTRRVVKLKPGEGLFYDNEGDICKSPDINRWPNSGSPLKFIYGQPGDRLWVRETFIAAAPHDTIYRADLEDDEAEGFKGMWQPSLFMPRNLCRIELQIEAVYVERLQDCGPEDAIAEGATPETPYGTIWKKINTKPGIRWEDNPWVWVLSFKRVTINTGDSV